MITEAHAIESRGVRESSGSDTLGHGVESGFQRCLESDVTGQSDFVIKKLCDVKQHNYEMTGHLQRSLDINDVTSCRCSLIPMTGRTCFATFKQFQTCTYMFLHKQAQDIIYACKLSFLVLPLYIVSSIPPPQPIVVAISKTKKGCCVLCCCKLIVNVMRAGVKHSIPAL